MGYNETSPGLDVTLTQLSRPVGSPSHKSSSPASLRNKTPVEFKAKVRNLSHHDHIISYHIISYHNHIIPYLNHKNIMTITMKIS